MMQFKDIKITTERLKIRPVKPKDLEPVYQLYADPEAMRYWSSTAFTERAQAEIKIKNIMDAYASGESVGLAITPKQTDLMIGQISLFNFHQPSGRAEIGYMLARAQWQKGYMYEAVSACIEYCFTALDLRRLEADIDPNNIGSAALLNKLGFKKEGLLLQRWVVDGVISDSALYGLLKAPAK